MKFSFQSQLRDMRLTFCPRASSLGTMQFSNVPSQASCLTLCLWRLGLTQSRTLFIRVLLVFQMWRTNRLTVLKIMLQLGKIDPSLNPRKLFSVVSQQFDADVFKVNVIVGNDVILSCVLPSHVSDLVRVTGWVDSQANTFTPADGLGNFPLPRVAT